MDNSKEGLMNNNLKKLSFSSSFDPISEKQEEMSIASLEGNNQAKPKNSNQNSFKNSFKNSNQNSFKNSFKNSNQNSFKNSFKNSKDNSKENNISKNILDDTEIIRHSSTQKNKYSWLVNSHRNNFLNQKDDNNKKKEAENLSKTTKSYKTKQNKKKIIKRISVQESRFCFSGISLPNITKSERKDDLKKMNFVKQFRHLNSINTSNLNKSKSLYNRDIIPGKRYSNEKSITNEPTIEMRYINNINKKKTILNKGKLNFSDNKSKNNILEQIKNSELYEKSELLLLKLKIAYGVLAVFSLICIILNFADVFIYNNKSMEYLIKENNNTYFFFKYNIESYYYINNRKITSKENSIRLFNGIFSLICGFILIIIYYIKNGKNENKKKNSKRERFKRILNNYYSKQRKKSMAKNKLKQLEQEAKNEKIKVVNLDPDNKDFNKEALTIHDRNKTIIMCILNIIFYPPFINKSFIGIYDNIIYVYSLNSLFLIISLYKITNIYISIFYLSPINNSFNKAICKSNLLNLDSKFMFKYSLNKFPIAFLLFNLIIVLILICIVLNCVEFFTLDINDNFWNNYSENEENTFFAILYSFLFFIIKNLQKSYCIKSVLGKILLYIGGIVGMLISSYFIYYINNFIKFSQEEQDAYSKLSKLLDPINKEHKASNLIKSLLLLKKNMRDNQNTEKDYRLKRDDFNRPTQNQRRGIFPKKNNFQFAFNSDITANNLNLNDYSNNEEKKKFIKYIEKKFLFKIKFTVEYKNYIDNLKIARNSAQSFKDVLKTVGNKMEVNISQLNNKIEVLIQNDQKFLNFMKFTSNTLKHIKKINEYHNSILQYFVEIHNEYVKQMIEIKKDVEVNSPIMNKSSMAFPKRIKSNIFSKFTFKKTNYSKIIKENKYKQRRSKNDLYDLNYGNNYFVKKQRSSKLSSLYLTNNIFEEKMKQARSKQNTRKSNKTSKSRKIPKSEKRTKSLDDWGFMKNDLKEKAKRRSNFEKKVGRSVSFYNKSREFSSKKFE